ncbi:MAG: phosphoglycerate kinase [Verrucomicrobia bacterium]|nr:phosphoglycerate kinase [Verrucomicrobiota bacterium]
MKLSLRDLDVNDRAVLVRVDFNVPLEAKDGIQAITDDTRIRETLPTIKNLRDRGARVILCAHLGRPKGKPTPEYSLEPVAQHLSKLIGAPVAFAKDCVGPQTEALANTLKAGDVLLLENLRFHAEEEKNDPAFAQQLAKLAELYVNDAFGAAHRAHASTAGVAGYVKQAAMGLLMEKELQYLQGELANPNRPFVVILGGAKVSDKIGVIKALMQKADVFLIGGAMAYTFDAARGIPVGNSRVEKDKLELAHEILALAKEKGVKFLLPTDSIETQEIKPGAVIRATKEQVGVSEGWMGVDIGPATVAAYRAEILKAQTVLWNGPMGIFEISEFSNGTFAIARALAENEGISIIGGGDSVTAVQQSGLAERMTFLSTGGGASLELLEGQELPGVAALNEK